MIQQFSEIGVTFEQLNLMRERSKALRLGEGAHDTRQRVAIGDADGGEAAIGRRLHHLLRM